MHRSCVVGVLCLLHRVRVLSRLGVVHLRRVLSRVRVVRVVVSNRSGVRIISIRVIGRRSRSSRRGHGVDSARMVLLRVLVHRGHASRV